MLTYYASGEILKVLCAKRQYFDFGDDIYLGLSREDHEPTPQRGPEGVVLPWNVSEPFGETTGYKRVLIGKAYSTAPVYSMMGDPENGVITNNQEIHFNETESGDWGEIGWACLFDAETGGNLLAWGELVNSQGEHTTITPLINNVVIIKENQLRISLT